MHPVHSIKDVFRMLLEATRAWMWQELVLVQRVKDLGSNTARLCLELLRLGPDWFWKAKAQGDERTTAMADAIVTCLDVARYGTRKMLEDAMGSGESDLWPREFGHCQCLLEVPDAAVDLVQGMVAERDVTQRVLMGAAGTLQNAHLGSPAAWLKPEVLFASLSALSAMPECREHPRDGDLSSYFGAVLERIRGALLRDAAECADREDPKFRPVPCGDPRATDMFGIGVQRVVFTGKVRGDNGGFGSGQLRLLRAEPADGEECHQVLVSSVFPGQRNWGRWRPGEGGGDGGMEATGEEGEEGFEAAVAAAWVVLRSEDAASVDVYLSSIVTECGLRLDLQGPLKAMPRRQWAVPGQ